MRGTAVSSIPEDYITSAAGQCGEIVCNALDRMVDGNSAEVCHNRTVFHQCLNTLPTGLSSPTHLFPVIILVFTVSSGPVVFTDLLLAEFLPLAVHVAVHLIPADAGNRLQQAEDPVPEILPDHSPAD